MPDPELEALLKPRTTGRAAFHHSSSRSQTTTDDKMETTDKSSPRFSSPLFIATARWIFALAIIDFGIQNFISAHTSEGGDIQVIPWLPAIPALAYLTAAIFLGCGLAILFNFRPRSAALLLAAFFITVLAVELIPRAIAAPLDLGIRTTPFEALSMCAGAMLIARHPALNSQSPLPPALPRWLDAILASARYLLAISVVVFGITHFLVLKFIGSLIPTWIKINSTGGIAWAAFTGGFLILVGILVAIPWPARGPARDTGRIAAFLLGLMFLLWFPLLHLPRVFSTMGFHKPDEWQSAFICFGMCGIFWMLASEPRRLI